MWNNTSLKNHKTRKLEEKMSVKTYGIGVPHPSDIRQVIGSFITEEAFVQFPCDFGWTPLNTMMFAYENPETPVEPLIEHMRKNGIAILSIKETPLARYPVFPYTIWYDVTFMAFSTEN